MPPAGKPGGTRHPVARLVRECRAFGVPAGQDPISAAQESAPSRIRTYAHGSGGRQRDRANFVADLRYVLGCSASSHRPFRKYSGSCGSGLMCGFVVTVYRPDDRHVRRKVKVRKKGTDIGAPLDSPADQPPVLLPPLVSGLQHRASVVLAGVSDHASGSLLSQLGSGSVQECGPLPFVVEGDDDLMAPLPALGIVGEPAYHVPHEVVVVRIDPGHGLSIGVVQVRCQTSYLDVRHGLDDGNRTRTVSLGICAFRASYMA